MSFDALPLWAVLLATLALVLLALQSGVRLGRWRRERGKAKLEVSAAMAGATMGLLAFMLAFTFNAAAGRYEARKSLVIEEANAIETTWLRAGFLPEPSRTAMRGLLRNYVTVRVNVPTGQVSLADGLRESGALQDSMWALAVENGQRQPGSVALGLFVQSLNEVIDLHLKRVTVGIRARVPGTIWVTLYVLMAIGMFMIGAQIGQSETRQAGTEMALAVSFSLVLFMIADLDRPQQGLIRISQQAMIELKARLDSR